MSIDTEHFRTLLLEERERVKHALKRLETDHGGALEDESDEIGVAYDNHMGDVATDTVNREIDYSLEANAEQHLGDIDAALKRIDDGTYGKCRVGGEEIPAERLEAIPWTAVCIDHADRG
jgi:RNA polymerase-binding transcription factor DksA